MSYYAKVVDGLVTKVIVCDSSFFDDYVDDSPGDWVETFMDGSHRANYAGVGYTYDLDNDVFYAPRPHASWVLSGAYQWEPPTPMPDDGKMYLWNELTTSWMVV